MKHETNGKMGRAAAGGLAGWLLEKLRRTPHSKPRLALLERIALAPRQTLALIEADGRRFLVATSPEGGPAFYSLDASARRASEGLPAGTPPSAVRQPARRFERSAGHPVARRAKERSTRTEW